LAVKGRRGRGQPEKESWRKKSEGTETNKRNWKNVHENMPTMITFDLKEPRTKMKLRLERREDERRKTTRRRETKRCGGRL